MYIQAQRVANPTQRAQKPTPNPAPPRHTSYSSSRKIRTVTVLPQVMNNGHVGQDRGDMLPVSKLARIMRAAARFSPQELPRPQVGANVQVVGADAALLPLRSGRC
jgi:hypothetical protein